MRKRWTLLPTDEDAVQSLQTALHIHPILCRLLVQRGVTTYEEAKAFFRPELSELHDPFLMKDMDLAVRRLEYALVDKERILLYGDYDVDGVTSVALMYSFLSSRVQYLDYYIPDREKEGYGLSMEGVDYARRRFASLIIVMDCGITAVKQVERAKSHGIDVIICDHHLPGDEMPAAAAILNPKQKGCNYPYKELSGCGIAFKLAQGFLKRNKSKESEALVLLDFLVLSIAADIVPMTGENRVLAFHGLKLLNATEHPGVLELIAKSGRQTPLSIEDIVFGLAPLVNAAGRLAHAHQAVELLVAEEQELASEKARELVERNTQRKEFDHSMQKEAAEMFEAIPDWQERRSLVLYQKEWHKGVVGIAAARMVERFHRPSILLTESNGKAVGSARSVPGFNVYQAIKACSDTLVNFGGHDHAAGLTLNIENVELFTERFEEAVRQTLDEELRIPELKISAVLNLSDITPTFWRIVKQFAPFGPGNRSPIFCSKNVVCTGHSKMLGGNHLKLSIRQENSKSVQGIAFDMGVHFDRVFSKKPFHVAYKIEEEEWQGEIYLRIVVKGFWFPGENG